MDYLIFKDFITRTAISVLWSLFVSDDFDCEQVVDSGISGISPATPNRGHITLVRKQLWTEDVVIQDQNNICC